MTESVFRKKNLDAMKSPDQLDRYIQIANPSGWIILSSVLIMLIGLIVWGVFGKIENKVTSRAYVLDGTAVCNVSMKEADTISTGMPFRIGETEGTIWEVDGVKITAKIDVADGVYEAEVITETIHPMSLILD